MTLNDMTDLIYIYDAVEEVQAISGYLTGTLDVGFGYGEGIIGELNRVTNVIAHNSPIYDEHLDFMNQRLWLVLCDREMSCEDRARILLELE